MSKPRKWVGRIYLGRDEHGAQQFEWVGRYRTRKERDDAVAKRRTELLTGARDELPYCDAYVDRYLREYARTHKTSSHGTLEDALKRFRRDFEGQRLDVTRQDAKDWAYGEGRWKQNGPVPASSVQPVVTLYNHAINEDDLPLPRNPFRNLGRRSRGRSEDPPPTEDEFRMILDACAVHREYAPMMRAFLLFAAFTLMRPGELFALEWTSVDFEAMRIHKNARLYRGTVAEPKTGPKVIALTPPARDAILGLPRVSPYVFTSKTGKRLSSTNFFGYWNVVRARAGLYEMPLYLAVKHYGVWYMWTKMGMSSRAIAAQAGWSLRTVDDMLRIYGHGDFQALEEVDAAFREAPVVPLRKIEGTG